MRKITSWLLLITIYVGSLSPAAISANGQIVGKTIENLMNETPDGLQFRLSEGSEGAEVRVKWPLAATDPLSLDDTQRLLKRIPEIQDHPNDQTDFAKRQGTLPAPKTGKIVPVKFPSDEGRGTPKVDTSKLVLQVLRYSPQGEVKLAPDLNVTFSQPMVAVTSQEQAAAYTPVELSPQVDGRWRWLGTKTLMFDTDKRFPMATKFTARVPAGTRSANGQVLQKDVKWTFTTPPPTVEQMIPANQTVRRDALIFISFDQAINPEAVLKTTSVTAGGKRLSIRLATQQEVDADASIGYYTKQSQPGRWMAVRVVNPDGSTANAMPGASQITVTLEKGTASAEGPITTQKAQSFTFQTYSPLKFARGYCSWQGNTKCSPFDQWYIEFNNSLDTASFTRELVKIDPPVDGAKIYPSGNYIVVEGYKKGRTSYRVTVDGSLKDIFGQSLGEPAGATIKVGSADQSLYSEGGQMAVIDPYSNASYSIYSTNIVSVKVRMYKVRPEDWWDFQNYVRRINYDDGKRPAIPGKLVSDKVLPIKSVPDEMVETRIDLASALDGGFGSVILDIEPTTKRDQYDRSRIFTWVQSTQIGLDAFVDNTELVGFASELKTGKPMGNVELSIYPNGKARSAIQQGENSAGESTLAKAWDWITSRISGPSDMIESADADGNPIDIETIPEAQSNLTADNGVLRMPLPDSRSDQGQNMLIARRGNDVAFLPENSDYYWQDSGTWYRKEAGRGLRWYVFDDRKMYKPNEEIAVKGWLRRIDLGKLGDIEAMDPTGKLVYKITDPRGNQISAGETALNAFGGFDLKAKLPDNTNLGYANIAFTLMTASGTVYDSFNYQFQIQEFRRPEFEVSTKVETEAPHIVGGSANVSVNAKYYAGGGLANAETNWTVTATPTNYTPPNRSDFTFGTWTPWWRIYDYGDYGYGRPYGTTQTFKGVTDASGKHVLKIDFESVKPPRPYRITASAAVQDVNRQTWSSSTSLLVHPSSLYVGIRTPRTFVQKGETINVESIVTDIDGNLAAGRNAEIKAVLKDWVFDKGSWGEQTIDEQACTVKSADTPQKCSFVARQGGRYTVTATVMDDRERLNQSEITVWVPGGKTPPKRTIEQEEVQIIPSKKEFAPGETAELLVISPFAPAEGILTVRRDGIIKTERFSMKDSSVTLRIPMEESYLPNVIAQVDLVGAAERTNDKGETDPKLAKRPAFASGNINLSISTDSRKLSVTAVPESRVLTPGSETSVKIEVKDHRGEPVANSEVALVVVDESVLSLTGYSLPDPLTTFYTPRASGTVDYHLRKDILLGNPADAKAPPPPPPSPANAQFSVAADSAPSGVVTMSARRVKAERKATAENEVIREAESPIDLRENFDALAVFSPSVRTDSSGRATVNFKLPDNLTRYRVTAVSVDAVKRFGKTESDITARQPLMVRPSAPRFMNFGDKIQLPVVVQNQTDKDLAVDIAVRAYNAELTGEKGKRVLVKANDRAEVRFPVSAMKAGTARFQILASSGSFSDAAEIALPVWTPATTEAFATYGTTSENGTIIQPVQTPGDVYPQFGSLEVTTSSTQLQELTDAFIFLYRYPFECSEQVASRMISVAALKDVLTAFKAKEMPSEAEIRSSFEKDVKILQSRQRADGSFGLWTQAKERYEYPFLTVHVAHALALATAKGYKVPDEMLNKTKPYLRDVEKHYDEWYKASPQVRWTISAYALYVRDMMGDKDTAKAKALLTEATIEKMPFEALGWILSVLANDPGSASEVEAITRFLMNHTTETASTANFVTDYGDAQWLIMYSNRRADAVLLEALIKADPNNDLIPKLVRGLLDHRKAGRWDSTQENVFILLALDKYFNAFEKVTPDFVTRIWLGGTYAGEEAFKGRSVDSKLLNIPMSYLVQQGGTSNLILDKQGAGRLYYRIGMKYAPKNLKLDPADYGFTVLRKYEAIDNGDDVRQNADGSWSIKSGARVRVRLTMVAQARRYHVALVDKLPAGMEILNPGLATTEAIPADTQPNTGVIVYGTRSYGYGSWWRQNWFEHQNFRDERAEAFASLLWEGVYNYSYVTRATTPGDFVVPPAKAEEMYHPETFGRTGTDVVHVE